MTSIAFDSVCHAFGGRPVLRDIDLELTEHRIGIIGANGSGKSTLARMMNGLVLPDSGRVVVNDLPVARNQRAVRRQVGFIFSDPDRQIIMPTVLEDVELSLTRVVADKRARRERALAALAEFGLADRADQPSHTLSGGQKQLLALTSIMVLAPSILVADEPTTMLDLRNAYLLRDVLGGLDAQLIVLTHHLELLDGYDRVIVLDEGRVVADGGPAESVAAYRALMAGPP